MPLTNSHSIPTREPLVTRGVVVGVVSALLAVLVAFGLPLTDTQQEAILGLVAVVAPLAVAWWARRKVTPVDPGE